jgi:hypothetical protein
MSMTKTAIEETKEYMKGVMLCCYCMEEKMDKYHCCQENHFIAFEDFDEDTQLEYIESIS